MNRGLFYSIRKSGTHLSHPKVQGKFFILTLKYKLQGKNIFLRKNEIILKKSTYKTRDTPKEFFEAIPVEKLNQCPYLIGEGHAYFLIYQHVIRTKN